MARSDIRRILLVAGGMGVLLVGALLYVLLVLRPAQKQAVAQDQIAAWEKRWKLARTCLLGEKPMAADAADAMTARELVMGTTDKAMGDCTKIVGGLVRPPGPSSGVAEVEAAWPVLERAVVEVAEAYAAHREKPLADNPLPGKLGKLQEAHDQLRVAAGLSKAKPSGGPPVPALAPKLITLDGKPVTDMGGITLGGTYRGRASMKGVDGLFDITWQNGGLTGAPSVRGVQSVPKRSWTVEVIESGEAYALVTDAKPPVLIAKGDESLAALVAIGEDKQRLVLYEHQERYHVARSVDSGATFASVPVPTDRPVAWSASPAGDRLDLAWTAPGGAQLLTITPANAAGPLPAPVKLPVLELDTWCTSSVLWLVGGTDRDKIVMRGGEHQGARMDANDPQVAACSDDRIVVTSTAPTTDYVCTAKECTTLPTAGRRDRRVVAAIGGHVLRVEARDRLVAVWKDSAQPTFYRLPARRDLYGVVELDGAPHLLLRDLELTTLEHAELSK